MNEVVRVGETVRRSAKPNEYANELLLFLEKQGFHQAPRYLGMDEKGREMLSYLEETCQVMIIQRLTHICGQTKH